MPTPADGEEPRSCSCNRRRSGAPNSLDRNVRTPAVEPSRRGSRVQPGADGPHGVPYRSRGVLPRIEQHVAERVPHLPRRRQEANVIAVRQHPPAPPHRAVHGERESRADRRHAARERCTIVRFHDQVRVIALQRIVRQPKARPRAPAGEGALDRADDRDGSQRRNAGEHAERDVRRKCPELRSGSMRQTRGRSALTSGTAATAAPAARSRQRKHELRVAAGHLDSATLIQLEILNINTDLYTNSTTSGLGPRRSRAAAAHSRTQYPSDRDLFFPAKIKESRANGATSARRGAEPGDEGSWFR